MAISNSHSTEQRQPVVVIAAGSSSTEGEGSIREIKNLLKGLGYRIAKTLIQRKATLGAPSVLGSGKLDDLRELCHQIQHDWGVDPHLAFVSEITPSQQRLLERDFETVVLDRTSIILRVFASRAQTRLSKLEIELAQLIYGLPRIRDDKALDDREGGGGRGGRGNSNVELAKGMNRERCAEIRREIATEQAGRQRRAKQRAEAPRVALIGYTNAGKSSWMRRLTGSDVLVEDKLFATLDTTVRALQPETVPRILVSDTVGFIQDLPHSLVASFRSTLDEALDTDLLVHVIDASDERFREHMNVTTEVLKEVGGQDIPIKLLLNKADLLPAEEKERLSAEFPGAFLVSSNSDQDHLALRDALIQFFEDPMRQYTLEVDFDDMGKLSEVRDEARVLDEKYTDTGVRITLLSHRVTLERAGLLARPAREKEAWED